MEASERERELARQLVMDCGWVGWDTDVPFDEEDVTRIAEAMAHYGAKQRLEEAKWWGDPKRENGPRTLYPNEQERLATLAAVAQSRGGADVSTDR